MNTNNVISLEELVEKKQPADEVSEEPERGGRSNRRYRAK